jgi:hypothetical protein
MTRKILKITVLIIAIVIIAIQFFGIERSNPPINDGETLEAAINVPADISMILARSCNDCHSHKTTYPWYAYIQPSGWFLQDHIEQGREHLNFSIFNTYSPDKKSKKLDEICEEVTGAGMPLPSYLWMHHEAAVSESEVRALCQWAESERSRLGPS